MRRLPPTLRPPASNPEDALGTLKVKAGRFMIETRSDIARRIESLLPSSKLTRRKETSKPWLVSFPAHRRSAEDLNWLMLRWPLRIEERSRPRLLSLLDDAVAHYDMVRAGKDLNPISSPPGFVGTLDPYQAEDVALMVHHPRTLNANEMGLGKTVETIAAIAAARAYPALIVLPSPNLQMQWTGELNQFLTLRGPGELLPIGAGEIAGQLRGLTPGEIGDAPIYMIHYGLLRAWYEVLSAHPWEVIVFDEVQELRRTGSQKYSAAQVIAQQAPRVWGLSGTPTYNYADEIWSVMNVIEPGALGTRWEFNANWAGVMDESSRVLVQRPADLRMFLLDEGLMFRRRKSEVLSQLPPKRRATIDVQQDEGVYADAMHDVLALARELPSIESFQFRRKAMLQIETGARQAAGLAKVNAVASFVATLIEGGEVPVVYAYHHSVHDALEAALAEYNPAKITGRESTAAKRAAMERFRSGAAGVVLVSLRAAAGLDGLQERGTVNVFAELDWSPAIHTQCEDRLHRRGLSYAEEHLLCYYLVSAATFDQVVLDVLGLKSGQFRELMGDATPDSEAGERVALARMRTLVERLQEGSP